MRNPKEYPRLLVTAEPFPDESLRGYLLRLCELNGYKHLHWLTTLAGYGKCQNFPNDLVFQTLRQISCAREEHLRPFAYNEDRKVKIGRDNFRFCYFGTALIRRSWLEQRLARICPRCIAETPYTRAIWDLKFVTACVEHNMALLEHCPHCHQQLNWSRSSVVLCKCSFDLRSATTRLVDGPELDLNKLIYSLGGLHTQVVASNHGLPISSLTSLGFSGLLDFIFIAGNTAQLPTARKNLRHGRTSLANAIQYTRGAAECLASWPKNFHAFLRATLGHRKNTAFFSITRELKSLYRQTYLLLKSPEYEFLRHAIAEHLHQNWDGGPRRSSIVTPTIERKETRYVTCKDVTSMLHSKSDTVLRLFRSGVLKGKTVGQGRNRVILITRRSLNCLRQHLSCCVNTYGATQMLGVTERTIGLLGSAGLLKVQKNPVRRYVRLFKKQDIDVLLPVIAVKASYHIQKARTCVSFRGALRRTRIPIANFLQQVQNGNIRSVGIDTNKIGLHKYLFDIQDLLTLKNKLG